MSETIGNLLQLTLVVVVGFLFAVAFYESLSTRDVLVARTLRIVGRITRARFIMALAYIVTVGIGIPVLVVFWSVVLEIGLFFVGSVDRIGSISTIAVAIVAAARVLAYIRQRTAHELAKAIPLALAFVLISGGALNLEEKLTLFVERPRAVDLTSEMILFLIGLEIGLRLLTDAVRAIRSLLHHRREGEGLLDAAAVMPPVVVDSVAAAEARSADPS